jgi:hypothetical protein
VDATNLPIVSRARERQVLCLCALVAAAVFWCVRRGMIDDAYITLSYARNLAFHGHWGLIKERPSNTATSPLNVILLAALTAVLRDPLRALAVWFVACHCAIASALLRVARTLDLPAWSAIAGWALLLFSPLLLSTVGLESILAAALLCIMLVAAVDGRPTLFGILGGLAVLTRIDLGLFVLVPLLAVQTLRR